MSQKVEYRNGYKYAICEQCGLDWNVSWQFVGWYVCPVCRNKNRKEQRKDGKNRCKG
uniref:Zinc-ribbon protein n=1 Tax=Siphoviridae sp. cthWs11 TaxID=2825616 RepID=A0A8S5VER7_9CAUD|nr:MAG TPA: zinc-ribbon protein [Siphoviridae sp. cthWs11]